MLTPPDLSSDAFHEHRYAAYRTLRDHFPFLHTEIDGEPCVVVTRYADVDALLRHPDIVTQPAAGAYSSRIGDGAAARGYKQSIVTSDDPYHTRVRRVVTPAFGPRALEKLRDPIIAIIERHLARIDAQAELDLVTEFAAPIAGEVAATLLGIAPDDAYVFFERSQVMLSVIGVATMADGALEAADDAWGFCETYMDRLIDDWDVPSFEPGSIRALLFAALGKVDGVTRSEMITLLIGFLIASYDTTVAMIANASRTLLEHPEQKRRLIEDPGLARSAWEESLRYEGMVHFMQRYPRCPIAIGDVTLEAGQRLILGLQPANRDERRFSEPDRFDIGRTDNRHLGFASGPHFCLGAQLARIEGELLLARLFQRFEHMALIENAPPRIRDLSFPVMTSMRVSLR